MAQFLLEKWYMDVISPEGALVIGYFAKLRWGRFAINYHGFVHRDCDGIVVTNNSFHQCPEPQWLENNLVWKIKSFQAEWNPTYLPVRQNLLDDPDLFVDWNCCVPKARCTATINDVTEIEGWGYAEKMVLNIPPWKLPIKELFWGRFLSDAYSVIWIEWRGPQPKILVILNGDIFNQATISNDSIQASAFVLTFDTRHSLRTGPVGETIFKGVRQVLSLFPTIIFQLEENKWCGVATLSINEMQHKGTYIHEQVIWQ